MSKRAGNETIETEPAASGAVTYPRPMGVHEAGDPAEVPPLTFHADGGADSRFFPTLSIDLIDESPMNPRKRYDPDGMLQLTESVRQKGVLTPLLVRPVAGGRFELAAGHRRRRAAQVAGLPYVPALARPMTDVELLEVLVIENDQREDVHPLEEAEGYQALVRMGDYTIAAIAAKVGRSEKYVYDRLKLLQLTPKAQELFLEDRFTAGHAILLARLSAKDQERAIDPDSTGNAYRTGGLFTDERCEELPLEGGAKAKRGAYDGLKPNSVRELQQWIRDSVRAVPERTDAFLFPETKALLDARAADRLKPILITRDHMAGEAVRHAGTERVFGSTAWRRADGQERSKACDWSRVGYVASGQGQGEAFMVCINRDKCETHWREQVRAKKQRAARVEKAVAGGADRGAAEKAARQREEQEQAKRQRQAERLGKATDIVRERVFLALPKVPLSKLGDLIVDELEQRYGLARSPDVAKLAPRGKTADELIRHLAANIIVSRLENLCTETELASDAAWFGIDAKKVFAELEAADKPKAAVQTSAKPANASGTAKRSGKKKARH